jgi:7-carboxy-7-deazaguanine synthase
MLDPKVIKLAVSEMFGPTIQGEGSSIGAPAVFLRLSGCNLACVWCDTPYTWDWKRFDPSKEVTLYPIADTARDLWVLRQAINGDALLVITGGEPLLQTKNLEHFFELGFPQFDSVEVETAGTILPSDDLLDYVDQFNVSPKLTHSGNPEDKRINPEALRAFAGLRNRAIFKFVVQSLSDLDEVDQLVDSYQLERVFVMAEGTDPKRLLVTEENILSACIRRGYRISPRLHIDLFGNRRGV